MFAIPQDRLIVDHRPSDDTYCGRVVQFFSADIRGLEGGDCDGAESHVLTESHDLALVEWLCEYKTPDDALGPTEKWTRQRLCYEPEKTWTDIIEVERILGPEPVVPYSRWPTIPHSEAKWKTSRFPNGKADGETRPGTGSAMFVRQTMLRRLSRVLPERIPSVVRRCGEEAGGLSGSSESDGDSTGGGRGGGGRGGSQSRSSESDGDSTCGGRGGGSQVGSQSSSSESDGDSTGME